MNIKLYASLVVTINASLLAMQQPMNVLLTPDLDAILRKNSGGWTPLHAAASGNDVASLEKLIAEQQRLGKSVDVKDKVGQTPLWHAAASSGCNEAIQLLLAAGANINEPDAQGRTPLHVVARYSGASRVKHLLDLGARADLQTHYAGSTPLHELATPMNPDNGTEDLHAANAKEILKRFGSPLLSIKGIRNITPAHLAAQEGRLKVLDVFVSYGLTNLHEILCELPAHALIRLAEAHNELQQFKNESQVSNAIKVFGVHIASDQKLIELSNYRTIEELLNNVTEANKRWYTYVDEPKRKEAIAAEIQRLSQQEIRYLFSAFHHLEIKKLEKRLENDWNKR